MALTLLLFLMLLFGFGDSESGAAEAEPAVVAETPVAVETPHTLTISIELRAKPEDMDASGEGEPCAGAGRFADLGPESAVAIYDADEVLLANGTMTDSTLLRAGTVFSECEMTFVIAEIPVDTDYILTISNRSVQTLSLEELEAANWSLNLNFGP